MQPCEGTSGLDIYDPICVFGLCPCTCRSRKNQDEILIKSGHLSEPYKWIMDCCACTIKDEYVKLCVQWLLQKLFNIKKKKEERCVLEMVCWQLGIRWRSRCSFFVICILLWLCSYSIVLPMMQKMLESLLHEEQFCRKTKSLKLL